MNLFSINLNQIVSDFLDESKHEIRLNQKTKAFLSSFVITEKTFNDELIRTTGDNTLWPSNKGNLCSILVFMSLGSMNTYMEAIPTKTAVLSWWNEKW